MSHFADSTLMTDRTTLWTPFGKRSLRGQLVTRFAIVFLLVTLAGTSMSLLGYHGLTQQAQRRSADQAAEHVAQRYATRQEYWRRSADEVKSQIDFIRVFASADQARNWLTLRAFFASLEGKLDRFPSGVVLDGKNRPLFHYGPQGAALGRRLELNPLSRPGSTAASSASPLLWWRPPCGWAARGVADW